MIGVLTLSLFLPRRHEDLDPSSERRNRHVQLRPNSYTHVWNA